MRFASVVEKLSEEVWRGGREEVLLQIRCRGCSGTVLMFRRPYNAQRCHRTSPRQNASDPRSGELRLVA
jgi:hypothetical protein